MSNTKKILSFIFLALLTLVLVGCELPTPSTDTVSRTESEARKDLETASNRLVFSTGELIVERDEITLTTTFASIKEISFTWTSSNETVIKITETEEGLKGVVTRPEDEDVEVTLSCTIAVTYTKADDGTAKKGSVTETKEFVFTVKKIDKGSEATIKVAKTLAKGETVTIEGVVTNVLYTVEFDATKENTVTGIFVSDETDGVYVYSKNGGVTAKVGDKVAITGVVDYYYGAVQISGGSDGSALSIKVVESGQTAPAYVSTEKAIADLYEEMVDGITNSKPTVCGSTFEVYAKVIVEVSGSYTNVYLADPYNNNVRFKVYYKTGFECVEGLTGNSMVEALKAFDGKYVRMPIIPYATDSSKAYCACLTAGKIVETGAPTITDEDLANQTKTKVENLSGKYTAGEKVELFTTDETTGATVEWTASVEGVIDLTTGLINEAATEQTVTLTATVTKGTVVVEATAELTIKAKPTEEPKHAGTEEDPYTVSDAVIMAGRLDEGETGTDMYYVKGEIKSITEVSTQYGNATFVITDGTENFICYRAKYLNNEKFTAEDQVTVGMVVVVYGKFTNYKGTIEFASGCYIKTIEDESTCDHVWDDGVVTVEPTCKVAGTKLYTCTLCGNTKNGSIDALGHTEANAEGKCDRCGETLSSGEVYERKTLAEFLALEDNNEVFYQIEGVITEIANTTYGNLYITDGVSKVYLYGLCSEKMTLSAGKFNNTRDFSTLNLVVGMHIVVISAKSTFNNDVQAVGSGLVSKCEATDAEKLYVAKEVLKVATSISDSLTLPTYEGVTISWASNDAAITIVDGVATVTQTSEEQVVTLTATLTLNEAKEVVEFVVKVAAKVSGDTKELTFDFVKDSSGWSGWGSGYTDHDVSMAGFEFAFSRANKQSVTITDAPVMCAKVGETSVTVNTGSVKVTSVTFTLKAWNATEKFDTLKIEYLDEKGNWVACDAYTGDYATDGFEVTATFAAATTSFRLVGTKAANNNARVGLVSVVVTKE